MNIGRLRLAQLCQCASMMVLAGAVLSSSAARAQSAPAATAPVAASTDDASAKVPEVVVTATRRVEKDQDVPVSTAVLTPTDINQIFDAGGDIRALAAQVPSLNIESSNGRTFPRLYIRGYGNTDFTSFASQPVSLVYDDVDQENPALKGSRSSTSPMWKCCAGRKAPCSAAMRRPASSMCSLQSPCLANSRKVSARLTAPTTPPTSPRS